MQARFFPRGAAVLLFALAGGQAQAAEQGAAGVTSRGYVLITASVANRSVASGFADVATGAKSAVESICLWSSSSTRGFGLTATGSGPEGALVVETGAGGRESYDVRWDGAALPAGARRLGFTSQARQPGCKDDIGRANLVVNFVTAADRHSGTLSLLVTPQ